VNGSTIFISGCGNAGVMVKPVVWEGEGGE